MTHAGIKTRIMILLCAFMLMAVPSVQAQDQPLPEAAPAPEATTPDAPAVTETTPAPAPEAAAPAEAGLESPQSAAAATAPATPPAADNTKLVLAPGELNPNDVPSLVFTFWEHTAIKDARRSRGMVRPPTDDELMKDLKQGPQTFKNKPPPEERDISLGGIVYVTAEDWTIWLNGKRVTPKALPKEAIDLKVYDGYIEMKWFDEYTNQIFPIRLRPHQRFNIDTRIFLPG